MTTMNPKDVKKALEPMRKKFLNSYRVDGELFEKLWEGLARRGEEAAPLFETIYNSLRVADQKKGSGAPDASFGVDDQVWAWGNFVQMKELTLPFATEIGKQLAKPGAGRNDLMDIRYALQLGVTTEGLAKHCETMKACREDLMTVAEKEGIGEGGALWTLESLYLLQREGIPVATAALLKSFTDEVKKDFGSDQPRVKPELPERGAAFADQVREFYEENAEWVKKSPDFIRDLPQALMEAKGDFAMAIASAKKRVKLSNDMAQAGEDYDNSQGDNCSEYTLAR